MKKIFSIILILVLSLSSFACSGLDLQYNLSLDNPQSWSTTGYEQSKYAVEKKNANGDILGTGSLIITIDVDEERTNASLSNTKYSIVTTSFSFTENGVTDTVVSSASFIDYSMFCVYSEKTATYGGNRANKSYSFTCDYENEKKAVIKTGANFENTTTLSTQELGAGVYDNETLYYLARAFNLDEQTYGNFLLTNVYDSYLAGAMHSYDIYYRTEKDLNLDGFAPSDLESWGIVQTMGKFPVYKVSLSINNTLAGPPVELWYSAPDKVLTHGNKKILAKIKTTSYAIPDTTVDYTMEYVLSSYTSTK